MARCDARMIVRLFGVAALLALSSCQSGNTGGGDRDFDGEGFDNTGAGSIQIDLEGSDLVQVSNFVGFRVYAKDEGGAPVTGIPVYCNTENGLPLLEPATGVESTDSNGQISGKVGCEVPGSLLMRCNLGRGTGKRADVTVRCTGEIPDGFNGFPPPTGGETLGGGVSGNDGGDVGGTDGSSVRISAISVSDDGSSTATTSIDVVQTSDCDGDPATSDPEPFYDTTAQFTVVNNSNVAVTFTSLRYTVSNFDGAGGTFTSSSISVNGRGTALDANGGQDTLSSLIFDAAGGGKRFIGASSLISSAGIRNIKFTLSGTNELGESVSASINTALSFDGFNRCTG